MADTLTQRAYSATQGKLFAIAQLAEDLPLNAMIATLDEAAAITPIDTGSCHRRGIASLRQVRALADAMLSVQTALKAIAADPALRTAAPAIVPDSHCDSSPEG